MNVGIIAKPNQKGQIVIPKEFRDALDINVNVPLNLIMRGKGIYIYPIAEVVSIAETESSYLNILEMTKGAWGKENWKKLRRKRKKIELTASKERKQGW